MLNKELLRKTMRAHADTQASLAEALGLDISTVNKKINESCGMSFTFAEMYVIKDRYRLSGEQANAIFFS